MRMRVCLVVLVAVVAALLTGCGGSSSGSSSTPTATSSGSASTSTTGTAGTKGPNAGHFKRGGLARPPVTTPATKLALTKFATCMRENGVKFPLPNTSGKGPIFSAKGVNVSSAKFKTADAKCRGDLLNALRAQRGAGKVSGTAGATGSTSQTKTSPAPKLKVKVPPKVAHALQQFTACMREHGITNFPEPEGASFNTTHSHLDPSSVQYKAAETKCNPILQGAF